MKRTENEKRLGFRVMLGAIAIAAFTMVGCGTNETAGSNDDGDKDDVNVEAELDVELNNMIGLDNPYQVAINGQVVQLPCTVDEFFGDQSAFTTDVDLEGTRDEYWCDFDLYNVGSDAYIGEAFSYHEDSSDHATKEEYVYWVHFERNFVEFTDVKLQFYGGLTFDSSEEEFLEVLGEPTSTSEYPDFNSYRWETESGDHSNKNWEHTEISAYFIDGELDEIYIKRETSQSHFY